jgi:hypothetical protein
MPPSSSLLAAMLIRDDAPPHPSTTALATKQGHTTLLTTYRLPYNSKDFMITQKGIKEIWQVFYCAFEID